MHYPGWGLVRKEGRKQQLRAVGSSDKRSQEELKERDKKSTTATILPRKGKRGHRSAYPSLVKAGKPKVTLAGPPGILWKKRGRRGHF